MPQGPLCPFCAYSNDNALPVLPAFSNTAFKDALHWRCMCDVLHGKDACLRRRTGSWQPLNIASVVQMCFGSKYNKHEDNKWAVEHFEDHTELSQADFAMLFSFPVFAALQEYGQDGTSISG